MNRNRPFLQIEKKMLVTPVFYLGAVKTGRLRHFSTAAAGFLAASQAGNWGQLVSSSPWRLVVFK
jgi:hypothetical protein